MVPASGLPGVGVERGVVLHPELAVELDESASGRRRRPVARLGDALRPKSSAIDRAAVDVLERAPSWQAGSRWSSMIQRTRLVVGLLPERLAWTGRRAG